jgi:hypothetical protein
VTRGRIGASGRDQHGLRVSIELAFCRGALVVIGEGRRGPLKLGVFCFLHSVGKVAGVRKSVLFTEKLDDVLGFYWVILAISYLIFRLAGLLGSQSVLIKIKLSLRKVIYKFF